MKGSINNFIVGTDAGFVDLATAQTIGGAKTFSISPKFETFGADQLIKVFGGRTNNILKLLFANGYWVDNGSAGMAYIRVVDTASSGGDLIFGTTNNGGGTAGVPTDKFFIRNNGKIESLNIVFDDGTGKMSFGNTAGQKLYIYDGGALKEGFGVDLSGIAGRELAMFHTSSNHIDGRLSFGHRYETDGTYTERMSLDGAGNMLLGDASGLASAKRTISLNGGGYDVPGAFNVNSNGDKVVLFTSAGANYDARIGVGSTSNMWFKSTNGAANSGKYDWYTSSPPVLQATLDSAGLTITGALTAGAGGSFANVKSGNGYQKLPGGLIIQWGSTPLTASSSSSVGFNLAFPTACVSVIASMNSGYCTTDAYTVNQFTAVSSGTGTMRFIAIGY